MKYQTADYIRSMLYALTIESGNDDYVAACRQRVQGDDVWEVCLFTRFDNRAEYFSLVILAKAICEIVPTLVMYEGRYNYATYGEDYRDAIVIW